MLRIYHASHMKSCDQVQRGGFTTDNQGRGEGRRITAGVLITLSFLSTLQPKRTHNRHIHTLCQWFDQKFEIWSRPGKGNLVAAVRPDQPTGGPWTGISLTCVQTVFLSFLVLE